MAVRGVQKNTDLSKLAVQSEDTTHPCPRHLIPSTLDVANKEQPLTNQKLQREKQKSKNRKRAKQLLALLSGVPATNVSHANPDYSTDGYQQPQLQ
jgi:hypothetical protein